MSTETTQKYSDFVSGLLDYLLDAQAILEITLKNEEAEDNWQLDRMLFLTKEKIDKAARNLVDSEYQYTIKEKEAA